MGKGGSAQVEVTDYKMSAHYGLGWGPVDALLGIYVGEKPAWEGEVTEEGAIQINAPDLFGGNKKEGGVVGTAYYLPGGPDQVMPEALAAKLGVTSATCPGFRGTSSIFFYGSAVEYANPVFQMMGIGDSGTGFYWVSNLPYLKDIWFRRRRIPQGLDPDYARIGSPVSASIAGLVATVAGSTTTLSDGVGATVGGHFITVDVHPDQERTITIDGLVIEITKDGDGNFVVAIGENSKTIGNGGTAFLYGVTINVSGDRTDIAFGASGDDANPSHIIYECLTNPDWGMGGGPINVQSFEDAAITLFHEGFGMSMEWFKQSTIETFVSEVIDHIQATIFTNPHDGLMTIKLIRDDYDPATLPVLTPDNCTINSFERKGWGETINEIVATWTNPANEQEETVSVQDLANCAIQGNIVSQSRNFYGVRNAELAMKLAMRDLRSSSTPLAAFDIEVDRSAWDFVPGGVVKLVYPEEGIDGVILRLGKIDYGKPGAPTIKINALEDIFGTPAGHYTTPGNSSWVNPAADPAPMEFVSIITMPRYFAEQAIPAATLATAAYPEVGTMILAAQPDGDTFDYELVGATTAVVGTALPLSLGIHATCGRAELSTGIPSEAITDLSGILTAYIGVRFTAVNTFVVIGDEIAAITVSDSGGVTIARGLLDTVPVAHASGTPLWFFPVNLAIGDTTSRSEGETVQYKLLSRTSRGALPFEDAPIESAELTARPWLPNRPGNVKIGGVGFGTVSVGDAATMPVTWANRNRLMEPAKVTKWTDGNVTPEAGQTTKITVMKTDRTVLTVHSGLTGTSFDLPSGSFVGESSGIVRVTAECDGLESLQGHEITVSLASRGYGRTYGSFYGGGGGVFVPIDPPDDPPPADPDPGDPWAPADPGEPWLPDKFYM